MAPLGIPLKSLVVVVVVVDAAVAVVVVVVARPADVVDVAAAAAAEDLFETVVEEDAGVSAAATAAAILAAGFVETETDDDVAEVEAMTDSVAACSPAIVAAALGAAASAPTSAADTHMEVSATGKPAVSHPVSFPPQTKDDARKPVPVVEPANLPASNFQDAPYDAVGKQQQLHSGQSDPMSVVALAAAAVDVMNAVHASAEQQRQR